MTRRRAPVELRRTMKRGMEGRDVLALQRALRAAECRKRKPSNEFGRRCWLNVRRFQRRKRLRVDGVVGPRTWERLQPYIDNYGRWLVKHAKIRTKPDPADIRERMVRIAMYAYANRDVIHYTQDARRMTDYAPPPNVPNNTDCSAFFTWVWKSAGAPDPNGFGYNGYGYTGTLLAHGSRIGTGDLKPGDAVFYHSGGHVAVYVGNGKVVSHGSEGGPYFISMYYAPIYTCRTFPVSA